MLILWQEDCATVGQIARRLQLDSHAVTPLVDRLRVAGLIRRSRGADRRQVMITATTHGHNLQAAAARAQTQIAGATALAPPQLADLRHQLRLLAEQLTPETSTRPTGDMTTTERNMS